MNRLVLGEIRCRKRSHLKAYDREAIKEIGIFHEWSLRRDCRLRDLVTQEGLPGPWEKVKHGTGS